MAEPFFIVGPTAVGKSRLAVAAAERCGAEIVNADAFQVYTGFALLTAKPTLEQLGRIPHHLVGTVPPSENYNVARFLEDARAKIDFVQSKGKLAVVVGGTGLYVKALTHGLSPLPEADWTLRAELDALELPALLDRLRALDPAAVEVIDAKNKRRLVRAIEVCLLTGSLFSERQALWTAASSALTTNGVYLVRPKTELNCRINARVSNMFQAGVVEEVRSVPQGALSQTAARMIGHAEITDYLDGRTSLEVCQENIRLATRRYAKRQVTWFQRESSFAPLPLSVEANEEEVTVSLSQRIVAHAQGVSAG